MQKYFSKRLEMQIPKENSCIISSSMSNFDDKLVDFLKNHFEFPSNNLDEISELIMEDTEMKKIIYDLPKIVFKEFPNSPIFIDFVKYDYPEDKILKIVVKTRFDIETSLKKEEIINNEVIHNHDCTKNEFFIRVEP